MSSVCSISHINSSRRNLNSQICRIYSLNATKDKRLEDNRLSKQILCSHLIEELCKTVSLPSEFWSIIKRILGEGAMSIYLDNWHYLSKNKTSQRKNQQDIIIRYNEHLVMNKGQKLQKCQSRMGNENETNKKLAKTSK